jgi:hypothetical protein
VTGCATGTVVLALKAGSVQDAAQNTGPSTSITAGTVTVDRKAPTVASLIAKLRSGTTLAGPDLRLRLSWTGSDTGGAGVASYEISRSTDGGSSWASLSTGLTSAAYLVTAPSTGSMQYRVRATDKAGNVGAWTTGPVLQPRLVQQTGSAIKYSSTWTTASSSSYSGGSLRYAKRSSASATYQFTGRAVAFVTTRASSRGSVRIYVDGTLASTVSLQSSSTSYRYVAWQKAWTSAGTHSIKLVVVGTAGHPRVDVDAFAILK